MNKSFRVRSRYDNSNPTSIDIGIITYILEMEHYKVDKFDLDLSKNNEESGYIISATITLKDTMVLNPKIGTITIKDLHKFDTISNIDIKHAFIADIITRAYDNFYYSPAEVWKNTKIELDSDIYRGMLDTYHCQCQDFEYYGIVKDEAENE
jgi:hypothetical protein